MKYYKFEDWKDLPVEEREKFGFYCVPNALESENSILSGWSAWRDWIKKEYPVQYFFREYLGQEIYYIGWRLRDAYYNLKCQIFPWHGKVRNSIPKTWIDCSELVRIVNFAILEDFYDEILKNPVEIPDKERQQKFELFLNESIHYIRIGRAELERQLDAAYPPHERQGSYQELYSEVDRIEKLIHAKDSQVLNGIIEWREALWT